MARVRRDIIIITIITIIIIFVFAVHILLGAARVDGPMSTARVNHGHNNNAVANGHSECRAVTVTDGEEGKKQLKKINRNIIKKEIHRPRREAPSRLARLFLSPAERYEHYRATAIQGHTMKRGVVRAAVGTLLVQAIPPLHCIARYTIYTTRDNRWRYRGKTIVGDVSAAFSAALRRRPRVPSSCRAYSGAEGRPSCEPTR
uniref:Uncharacterized protein n=1 Tax=Sipha flava TaxID=143950 RepID=A0A2S2PXB0_9HEMI